MTADAAPVESLPEDMSVARREEILNLLADGIEEAHRKVEEGRVRDAEKEQVRIKWIRALAYSCGQYRQLKKDQEMENLHAEVDELRRQVEGDHADADADAGEVDR